MDCKNRIIKLRESTGLNRKDFCKLVHIPYRTMTEWELDNRHAPDYVLWLLEYYIRNEGLMVKGRNEGGGDSEKEKMCIRDRCIAAAVFGVPCVGGEEPLAADFAFFRGMTNT